MKVENVLSFRAEHTHARMDSHKEKRIKVEPRIYALFVFELDDK